MELTNEFVVGVPLEQAWELLIDVERISPCLPGAELLEVKDGEYHGRVKVKVGPIVATYSGVARFLEMDASAHRVVLRAEGRETRGQGNATATITATLEPVVESTRVKLFTDLLITGKVAQFGRGVLTEVSATLLSQFVNCLEMKINQSSTEIGVNSVNHGDHDGRVVRESEEGYTNEPVNLFTLVGPSLRKRAIPIAAGLCCLVLLVMLMKLIKQDIQPHKLS
jgi:carbon monoxide dehydrogenase subunit G